ncbi:MAG: type II secretion system protein, partial [Thiomargarita sp.]|nr:type II secretion system protein [Thiomargarita sp.]
MKIINQKAFTLIEITFLLVIFGLLMGSLLAPISAIVYQYNINYTENQLEEIKEALLGFAVLHKRLPCPD